jgi:hypothetical protein
LLAAASNDIREIERGVNRSTPLEAVLNFVNQKMVAAKNARDPKRGAKWK